jgi:hypothetical protein
VVCICLVANIVDAMVKELERVVVKVVYARVLSTVIRWYFTFSKPGSKTAKGVAS